MAPDLNAPVSTTFSPWFSTTSYTRHSTLPGPVLFLKQSRFYLKYYSMTIHLNYSSSPNNSVLQLIKLRQSSKLTLNDHLKWMEWLIILQPFSMRLGPDLHSIWLLQIHLSSLKCLVFGFYVLCFHYSLLVKPEESTHRDLVNWEKGWRNNRSERK